MWGRIFMLALCFATGPIYPLRAQGMSECQELWVIRNSFFKRHGYCFHTPRAIAYFGNAGCLYSDQNAVPLSNSEGAEIRQLVAREHALACPTDPGIIATTPNPMPAPAGPSPSIPPAPGPATPSCQKYPELC
jgi:hypothetical protein